MRYFLTKQKLLQYKDETQGVHISFGKDKRYATDDPDDLAYLDKELAAGKKAGKPVFREVTEDEYKAAAPKGPSPHDQQAQILAAMAMSRGGEPLSIPSGEQAPTLRATSTADSPTTGGTNPAGMNVTQAETIAAIRAKVPSARATSPEK